MASEGAGGLSTTAIEAAIDRRATHRHEAVVRDVEARAELAALVAEAGRAATTAAENAALREALADCLPFLGGYQCDGMTEGDALTALERRIDALLADARPGAAGARDETTALAVIRAELATPLAEATKWHYSWREAVGDGQPRLTVTIGAMQRIADALDALRAGGAGER